MTPRRAPVLLAAAMAAACAEGGSAPLDVSSPASDMGARLSRGASLAAACSGCHAAADRAIPSLSGASGEAIAAAFAEYKRDAGGTTVMHRLARGYDEADIALIADYLGRAEGS